MGNCENDKKLLKTDCYDEDEIDLIEVFATLWQRKIMIIAIVFIGSVLSVIYALSLDNIYQSKAVLKPSAEKSKLSSLMDTYGSIARFAGIQTKGDTDNIFNDMKALLSNQVFIANVIKKHNLERELFGEDYDEIKEEDSFKQSHDFLVYKALKDLVSISQDKDSNYITLAVQHKNPKFAEKLANIMLEEISENIKLSELGNIDEKITNFKEEMGRTSDITLKRKLSEVIASLIQSKVLSSVQKYYGFTIVSKPYAADLNDKVKPKRSLICIVGFILFFILAVALAFLLDYIQNIPEEKKELLKSGKNAKK
jgi:uncharacterized protein involved in exopolysaccharide biosynthesis